MLTSSKFKVQNPTSHIDPRVSDADKEDRDVGLWTLDRGLEVSDLRKSFSSPVGERVEVLRGVSFSAGAGQALAVTGVSGAGKTTLLNLLGGIEAPDHGRIVLGDFEVHGARTAALACFRRHQVGFLFQFHHLLLDLSAVENVALPLTIARASRREAMGRAAQSLENVALGDRMSHPVGQLSGGEQQRVAVCRALITEPKLVLADEPTGNLDASFAGEIGETLVSYARRRGAIVVMGTHNEELAQLCDRMLVLTGGRLYETG